VIVVSQVHKYVKVGNNHSSGCQESSSLWTVGRLHAAYHRWWLNFSHYPAYLGFWPQGVLEI